MPTLFYPLSSLTKTQRSNQPYSLIRVDQDGLSQIRAQPRHSRQTLYHKIRLLRHPKKAVPKPDLMIKLEPILITVRVAFAHLLSHEIIGNMHI
jgi:hypothetical protein